MDFIKWFGKYEKHREDYGSFFSTIFYSYYSRNLEKPKIFSLWNREGVLLFFKTDMRSKIIVVCDCGYDDGYCIFILVFATIQIPLSSIAINFLIPFNISSGVCFHLLCKKGFDMEYVSVCLSMAFVIVWSMIVANDVIYYAIVEPLWLVLILISFGYLVF